MVTIDKKYYGAFEKIGDVIELDAKKTIFMDEDEANDTFLIESGRVRAFCVSKKGKETTFEVIHEGRIFGEASFCAKAMRDAFIETVTKTRLVVMKSSRLIELMHEDTHLMVLIFQHVIESNQMLVHAMKRMINYNSSQKVADFLLEISQGKATTVNYSQKDISECLAMNRVTVARVIADFKEKGLVETSYKKLTILDAEGLRGLLQEET